MVWSDTWLLALVAGGHVLFFAWFFPLVWSMRNSGIGLFFDFGTRIVRGALPYRDFAAEYPPLAMGVFAAPRLVASTLGGTSPPSSGRSSSPTCGRWDWSPPRHAAPARGRAAPSAPTPSPSWRSVRRLA